MRSAGTPLIRLDYTPHARAERLIATGRFVLAFASLAAIYFEPSSPAQYQKATYSLLAVYTLYALGTLLLAWRWPVPPARWRLVSHVLDLTLFSLFIFLTEGPASPFFLYFVFSLFCATLRFSWRGILATGVVAIAVYGTMSLMSSVREPDFDGSRPFIRVAYLGVIATLLVHLGIYQQQLRTELISLAAWPRDLAARIDDVLKLALDHAGSVLARDHLILLWEESEEPWLYIAENRGGIFRIDREPPASDQSGAALLLNSSAWVRSVGEPVLTYDPARTRVSEASGDPIGADVRERFGIDSAMVVSLASETLSARLIVPGVRSATADDLALAYLAGRLVLAALEQFFFVQQVRQTASTEERLRLSRELHDGTIQSLAGVGLRLQGLRNRFPSESEVGGQLLQLQNVLERDQRELRAIVRELRPHDGRQGADIVTEELQRMRQRFPLEWGLEVSVAIPEPVAVSPRLAHEVCRMVNEALSNAARHGGATRTLVTVMTRTGGVQITVRDNGRGFTFHGRRELEQLDATGEGPRTLKERTRSLGGTLAVDSSAAGASIEIRLPATMEIG